MKNNKLTALASAAIFKSILLSVYGGTDAKDLKDLTITPTLRTDTPYYVGVYGGTQFATSYGNHRGNLATSTGSNYPFSSDSPSSGWGGVGGIKFGYNFEPYPIGGGFSIQPAVEAEAFYLGQDTHSTSTVSEYLNFKHDASWNSADLFVNGIVRLKNPSKFTPYLGLGLGGQYVTVHSRDVVDGAFNTNPVNGSDIDFAVQGLAGFDFEIVPNWDLFSEYKFVDALGTDIKGSSNYFPLIVPNTQYRMQPDNIAQNVVVAGVKYNF